MEVIVRAPATCGEFIQGIWRNQPCLVSAPVDIYSTTHIKKGIQKTKLGKKAEFLINLFLNRYGVNSSYLDNIDISISSEIPKSIGMGSSTADLASLLMALSAYFFVDVSEEEMAKILTEIEPTDNSFFHNLNLFNQYTGDILYSFNASIDTKVIIVDRHSEFKTTSFNYGQEFSRDEIWFQNIIEKFYQGLLERNISLIGEAATDSYILNQNFKHDLEQSFFLYLKDRYGSPGIVNGHTGSVIGFLTSNLTDVEGIKNELKEYNKNYKVTESRLIRGGLSIERFFD